MVAGDCATLKSTFVPWIPVMLCSPVVWKSSLVGPAARAVELPKLKAQSARTPHRKEEEMFVLMVDLIPF
jgi:hypothetical protein